MSEPQSRNLSRYFRHHIILLTIVLVVLGLVMFSSQRRMAPEQMNPWVDTGCDLSRGACQFLPASGEKVVVSGTLERLGEAVWGSFEAAAQGRPVDTMSVQVICIDPQMQHNLIEMTATGPGRFAVRSQLPDCQAETRLRQVRVYLESQAAPPLAVSFQLSG